MSATAKVKLNASQVLLLQALAKLPEGAPGLSLSELKERIGFSPSPGSLGPKSKALLHDFPHSLYAFGYVRPVQTGDDPVLWSATARGRKVAGTVKARPKTGTGCLGTLTSAELAKVAALKDTRTYGFELYTAEDLGAVRAALQGTDCTSADDDLLRQWLVNARKKGLFADKSQALRRSVEKVLREFGNGGTVIDGLLTQEQIFRIKELLG